MKGVCTYERQYFIRVRQVGGGRERERERGWWARMTREKKSALKK